MRMSLRTCTPLALGLAIDAYGVAADAQTAAPPASAGIQDIVVTATRRSESANRIPLAIEALAKLAPSAHSTAAAPSMSSTTSKPAAASIGTTRDVGKTNP